MSEITVSYKGNTITTMDASGTKTLLTEGKYCEDDITVVYDRPSGGISVDDIATGAAPTGAVVLDTATSIKERAFSQFTGITSIHAKKPVENFA